MNLPISVLLPVYNSEKYLKEAISSTLSQTYRYFELIAVDDGSSDNSLQILADFAKKDSRIKIFKIKHSGMSGVLNEAIRRSSGKYLARMDSDDVMDNSRLKKQKEFLEKNNDVVVVGSWVREIDLSGKNIGERKLPTKHGHIYQMMNYVNGVQTPSIMINRSLIDKDFSWYREKCLVEDLDLYFRLFKFGKFENIPEFLMNYRIRRDSATFNDPKKNFEDALTVRRRAVKEYGYKPNLKSRFLQNVSRLTLTTVPRGKIIYGYSLFRKLSTLGFSGKSRFLNV